MVGHKRPWHSTWVAFTFLCATASCALELLENLFLSSECANKIWIASCPFRLTAGSVLYLEVFGGVCVHLCCTAHRSYNQSWGILSLKSPFASGAALDLKTTPIKKKNLSQKYRMNNHFWASRTAAAHRKEAHFSHLHSHNRSSQIGQATSHHGYLAETHQLHSCSTSCPPPSPDVQGTGHSKHPSYRGFCYTVRMKPSKAFGWKMFQENE